MDAYLQHGFVMVPGLFTTHEAESLRDHYMEMRKGTWPGDDAGIDIGSDDPLKRYPRLIHMHRWDEKSMRWAVDQRINEVITELTGVEPFLVQTMLYFKPPGARGQALHQDQFYLRAQPGTCIAAWLALDDCDEDNGCMQLVPNMPDLDLLCTEKADIMKSFTGVTVHLPESIQPIPAVMKAGDVLFFHGSVIHGSFPNESKSRFRRALIGHYLTGDVERVNRYYHPVFRMNGEIVDIGISEQGSQCGVWVEREGGPSVQVIEETLAQATEEQISRQ